VRREVTNPFTGETSIIETRAPSWPQAEDVPVREPQVVCIVGDFKDYLEGRLPQFVQSCPHWAAKGLTSAELDPLFEALGMSGSLECALYSPPSSAAVLEQFPRELISKLGELSGRALETIAKRWAVTMSTPEYTHSASGVKLNDGWSPEFAEELLQPIVALARRATSDQQMYLLIEC
jgi:hypothetical protein